MLAMHLSEQSALSADLRCFACGYCLRGLPQNGRWMRCPECGEVDHIDRLYQDVADRTARNKRLDRDLAVLLGMLATGLMICILAGETVSAHAIIAGLRDFAGDVQAAKSMLDRGRLISTGLGLFLGSLASFVMFLLATMIWAHLRRWIRAVFAVLTVLIAVFAPIQNVVMVLALWAFAFHAWAVRKR
jgi:hypothetical protein